ncbi:MAG: hypothetical protein KGJ40_09230 [candidate division NC10 bacterium]|nr:hypothetical protein [candidate division NC10 bacterium]MDE2483804.1 hypothetical protein [candidate division NC10 bacterium]
MSTRSAKEKQGAAMTLSSPNKLRTALLFAATLLTFFLSACGFPAWRDQALCDVAEGRWHVNPEQVPPGSAPSQTIEFYDTGGKHVGYGKVQGGTAEFFNADGSRAGFGKVGR